MSNLQERFEAWVLHRIGKTTLKYLSAPLKRLLWESYQACAADLMPAVEKMRSALDDAFFLAQLAGQSELYKDDLVAIVDAAEKTINEAIAEADKILGGK